LTAWALRAVEAAAQLPESESLGSRKKTELGEDSLGGEGLEASPVHKLLGQGSWTGCPGERLL
ncbi:unnamed protein product, partial [Gulo gulo]